MRTILKNAKIYVDKGNFQESMLIVDGIIKELGANDYILKFNADNVIDIGGKTVLPGLNDSHMHLTGIGKAMTLCDLSQCESIDDIVETSKRFLEENNNIKLLLGRGWNQDNFKDVKRIPSRFDLDRISTDIPIILKRVCEHVVTVNSKVLNMLDIDEHTAVDGGEIIIGSDGKPNGTLTENAIEQLTNKIIPQKTNTDIEKDFIKAAEYAISVGLTSVQSNDVINDDFNMFKILHNIYDNKKTKLRYDVQFNFQYINYFTKYLETEFKTGLYDGKFISKGALKLFKDGSLGGRTALMLKNYYDEPGIKGIAALSDEQLYELCDLATSHNIRVVTHAIGDGAIESVINAYERTMNNEKNKNNILRHGIVHCQITNKEQLKRIAKLNIAVMYQPIFLDYDTKIVEQRVGKELAYSSYAFNTLIKLCAPVSFGTDSPVEDCNPFPNIYCAVTRQRLDGTPIGGYVPAERLSIEDAIDAYTIGSAYNEFKESYKGRLYKDYVADLIVLDKDIFTVEHNEIKDIKVELTMIDGEIVFKRKK